MIAIKTPGCQTQVNEGLDTVVALSTGLFVICELSHAAIFIGPSIPAVGRTIVLKELFHFESGSKGIRVTLSRD